MDFLNIVSANNELLAPCWSAAKLRNLFAFYLLRFSKCYLATFFRLFKQYFGYVPIKWLFYQWGFPYSMIERTETMETLYEVAKAEGYWKICKITSKSPQINVVLKISNELLHFATLCSYQILHYIHSQRGANTSSCIINRTIFL